MSTPEKKESPFQAFVSYLIDRCERDTGFAARMRRADSDTAHHECWETLVRFGVPLEFESPRLAYQLICAAVARTKVEGGKKYVTGTLPLGKALYLSFPDVKADSKSDPALARLRRLFACDSLEEVCMVLRPMIRLIQSRVKEPLDYAQLLTQLAFFERDTEKTKAEWATAFFRSSTSQADKPEEKADV